MRKIRILLVGSPALAHVIRHLFNGSPKFEVVGSLRGLRGLAQQADRLRPELIVANVKPIRTGISDVVVAIRASSPLSRLILICPTSDLIMGGGRCGADACLDQEKLVHRLVPTASTLSAHVQFRLSDSDRKNQKDSSP